MITNIVVKFNLEGLHFWADAEKVAGKSVAFLQYPHRHMFYFICKKSVKHDDRDIEIIKFKREIVEYLTTKYKGDFGGKSCEMLCRELVEKFELVYCQCLEDNENGAEIINE